MNKKILLGSGVVLAVALIVPVLFFLLRPDNSKYDACTVTRGTIRSVVLSSGVVKPENKLDIKPPINGRADSVLAGVGDKVKKGQVLAWMSSTDRAVLLDAARTKGPEVLAHWEDYYKPAALIAPLDGTIILENLNPGQVVTSSDVVFSMSDHLIITANLDETDLSKIQLKQKVKLALDAYPDKEFTGKVELIAFSATTVNSVTTYAVDILPDEVPEYMRSGMTANATFIVDEKKDTLLVPYTAVSRGRGQSTVLVPGSNNGGQAAVQVVATGLSDGKKIEILSGLKEGDTVLQQKFQLSTPSGASGGSPLIPTIKRSNSGKSGSSPPHP